MFLVPEGPCGRGWVDTPHVALLSVAVKNYEEAVLVAKELVEEGIQAIELCAGFGHIGTAMVVEGVEGKVPVGVVRFDTHPAMGGKSGDEIFKNA